MGRTATIVVLVVTMAALIVAADILFFRNDLWPRLMVNVGIVLVFAAFGLRFAGRS
jgi:protein-S-isoprenylcysteine O-methyltransferase Ste14